MPYIQPAKRLHDIPTGVYNYMIAPVLGYDIDGMIWYQGESNVAEPHAYKTLYTEFVLHLRKHYKEDLPVIFTQLANFIDPFGIPGENWATLRDQQRQCLELPHTAMAVAIDCGEWNDIHPQDKKTVGERLALCARRLAYGEDVIASGPAARKAVICNGELRISFDYGEGLWAKNGRPVVEVVDSNETVRHLYAKIEDTYLIAHVGETIANRVRFGWTDCPAVVLYNACGLPASPFNIPVKSI
jgi:sialate O-acetylesterase